MARLSDHTDVESEPIRIEREGEPVVRGIAVPRPARVTIEVRGDTGEVEGGVQVTSAGRGCGSTPGPPAETAS